MCYQRFLLYCWIVFLSSLLANYLWAAEIEDTTAKNDQAILLLEADIRFLEEEESAFRETISGYDPLIQRKLVREHHKGFSLDSTLAQLSRLKPLAQFVEVQAPIAFDVSRLELAEQEVFLNANSIDRELAIIQARQKGSNSLEYRQTIYRWHQENQSLLDELLLSTQSLREFRFASGKGEIRRELPISVDAAVWQESELLKDLEDELAMSASDDVYVWRSISYEWNLRNEELLSRILANDSSESTKPKP